ncbi:hypothetical protein BDN67DRAFT_1012435 [Paxillus ammoniavirescens]|nr:hypothetical protein BDN67DRAFT_1012435 [Paxillus ammoniavirescens]
MYHSLESRIRVEDLPAAQRSWRRALGHAGQTVRRSRSRGGHTLPVNFTTATQLTPAKSRHQVSSFYRELSAIIHCNCRRHNITLSCGAGISEISDEEWEYWKREQMFFTGPPNLRPYQDPDWFEKGKSGEGVLNVSFFRYISPFTPLGEMCGCRELGACGRRAAFPGPDVV